MRWHYWLVAAVSIVVSGLWLLHARDTPTLSTFAATANSGVPEPASPNISAATRRSTRAEPLIGRAADSPFERLWHEMMAASRPETTSAFKGLLHLAGGDSEAANELIRRYGMPASNSKQARAAIIALLSGVSMTPDTLMFSQTLTASEDPAMRRDGYQLLLRLPGSNGEIHARLANALASERDPVALSAATQALAHVPEPQNATTADASSIVTQLHSLTANPDPGVRTATMQALAVWDRSATVEHALYQGITDPVPRVREAAISAVGYANARSERLKTTLLEIAQAPNQDARTRSNSVALLRHAFSLSDDERSGLEYAERQIDEQLDKRGGK